VCAVMSVSASILLGFTKFLNKINKSDVQNKIILSLYVNTIDCHVCLCVCCVVMRLGTTE